MKGGNDREAWKAVYFFDCHADLMLRHLNIRSGVKATMHLALALDLPVATATEQDNEEEGDESEDGGGHEEHPARTRAPGQTV